MIIKAGGVEATILDDDDRMVFHIKAGNGFGPESLAMWAQMVKPGRVALDVGAYTGLYSIIAAKLGAQAVAFEPMPANRWRLGINIQANKVKVEVLGFAASDRDGVAELHYNTKVPLTTGGSIEAKQKLHHSSLSVPTKRIDSLAFSNVAAIKIDVERHEPAVLRGAMNTIHYDRPLLLIETLDSAMRDQVLDLLPRYNITAMLDGRNALFTPK